MQQILIYSDSLSWGIVPGTRRRFAFHERWPGVLEQALQVEGHPTRVLEDCLNGRCTVLDDPIRPGRNGLHGLAQRIEMHSPLALVILMLGTNDFQAIHRHSAKDSAQGIGELVRAIRHAPVEPNMPTPSVLIVIPPAIIAPAGAMVDKFAGAEQKCVGLAQAYREVAEKLGCPVFDTNSITSASRIDGIHLDADQHVALGRAIAQAVKPLLTHQ
ncbi:hypothetical protein LMG7141_03855 [Ralstonia condita]|uniref:SGNH hydrolase-type esterase domain-containing protein n=1 Tax=Ralstonia condita TaxID=3058600 RepID=A0ABN9J758_9RALS|nr:SGNH/GDSL hydrolase family protein [Ralstonia sp. LMG 7141]CAJ0800664.1 hypothetical protein LMG7141_03855 [Ralstonia sp. LMG 7141]